MEKTDAELDLSTPSDIAEAVICIQEDALRMRKIIDNADRIISEKIAQIASMNETLQVARRERDQARTDVRAARRDRNEAKAECKAATARCKDEIWKERAMHELQLDEADSREESAIRASLSVRACKFGDVYEKKPPPINQQACLPTHLFVVVSVDGDFYRFSRNPALPLAMVGCQIAQNLSKEISKYLLSHPEISPHSKTVVRVFCNRSALTGKKTKVMPSSIQRTKAILPNQTSQPEMQTPVYEETLISFAETYPLFDFIDCGGGKERADDKIRENCYLYMSDDNCYAVFLAIGGDNGFARMLQRYDQNPPASSKIVLLTNGFLTKEIAALPFAKVELTGIFLRTAIKNLNRGTASVFIPISQIQGCQLSRNYDLNYTQRPIREKLEILIESIRSERKIFDDYRNSMLPRMPYERNEAYEKKVKAILQLNIDRRQAKTTIPRLVSPIRVGLQQYRPKGMERTAPILPFIFLKDTVVLEVKKTAWSSMLIEVD